MSVSGGFTFEIYILPSLFTFSLTQLFLFITVYNIYIIIVGTIIIMWEYHYYNCGYHCNHMGVPSLN